MTLYVFVNSLEVGMIDRGQGYVLISSTADDYEDPKAGPVLRPARVAELARCRAV